MRTTPPPTTPQHCLIHAERRAAARCSGCQQSFCMECVTDFRGRVLCTSCFKGKEAAAAPKKSTSRLTRPIRAVAKALSSAASFAVAFFIIWGAATFVGKKLVKTAPSSQQRTGNKGEAR